MEIYKNLPAYVPVDKVARSGKPLSDHVISHCSDNNRRLGPLF